MFKNKRPECVYTFIKGKAFNGGAGSSVSIPPNAKHKVESNTKALQVSCTRTLLSHVFVTKKQENIQSKV